MWRHALAMVYDLLLISPFILLGTFILLKVYGLAETASERTVPAWLQVALCYGTFIGFYGTFWRQKGQTLGMQAWRVKLVSKRGAIKVSWRQAASRIIVASIPFVIALMPYRIVDVNNAGLWIYVSTAVIASSGFLWRFVNRERLYLHDLLTQTELRLTPPRKKA